MSIEGYCAYYRGKQGEAPAVEFTREDALATTIRASIKRLRTDEVATRCANLAWNEPAAEGIEVVEHEAPE